MAALSRTTSTALLLTAITLSGCDQSATTTPVSTVADKLSSGAEQTVDASGFHSFLGLSAYTSLSHATQQAQQLDQRLSAFLHQPDATHLVQVQSAWRQAYDAYLNTLIYTYLPVKDPAEWRQKGIDYKTTVALLDSWPIEGGYIDHVPGYPFSGIVNDLALELNEESLLAQHGFSDPSYASLGYHPLEFMLWGANGDREAGDFIAKENTAPVVMPSEGNSDSEDSTSATPATVPKIQNHNRRRQYVQLLSDQLLEQLHRLQRRWQPSNGYYTELLSKTQPNQALLAAMMAGQSLLSKELLDRRLGTNSSEFSNTGIDDIIAISDGLKTLMLGNEEQSNAVISLLNAELQQNWQQQFAELQQTLTLWQEQGLASAEVNQQVRQQFIGLLSLLEKSAASLNLRLPRSEDLARH